MKDIMQQKVSASFDNIYANDYEDYLDDIPDLSLHVIVISGIGIILTILLLQYCVLRYSKIVKPENIITFLVVGTLTTFLLSAVSIELVEIL